MFTKPIFETLPIAIIAASILFMLLLHTITALILGGLLIIVACVALFRRLSELGTNPDVMDYIDSAKRTH